MSSAKLRKTLVSSLLVYTAAFYPDHSKIHHLRASCDRLGVNLGTYGDGEPWPDWIGGKVHRMLDYLRTRNEAIVLYTDGEDSFLRKGWKAIMDGYHSFPQAVTLSGEMECFPVEELADYFPVTEPFRYPNSGGILANRVALIAYLEDLRQRYDDTNDQARWIRFAAEHPDWIGIDTQGTFFRTMSGPRQAEIPFGDPCVVHFNGRMKGIEEAYERDFPTAG